MRRVFRRTVFGGVPAPAAAPVRPGGFEYRASGPAEGSPRPTIAAFAAGWQEVVTKYLPKNSDGSPNLQAQPLINFDVAQSAHVWVESVVQPRNSNSGEVRGDVYNAALMMGVFCLYSAVNGWTPELMGSRQRPTALPEIQTDFSDLAAAGLVKGVKLNTTARGWSAMNWAHFDGGTAPWLHMAGGGPDRSHVVHAGLYVLGALASTAPGTALAVRHEGQTHGFGPQGFEISGVQPYPPDPGFPPMTAPR
jgi:hypothetical protein